ncbi:AaceriAEL157Wp [[Ashbya] aceris (nom. inval.)]|nr:AaceriAEL157Wp [[Ashbya] aceris (nom. inval.)]
MSSRKQDYIAKVSYRNSLPPPPLPPKLLKYRYPDNEAVESPQLITSLYTKTNVTPLIQLDKELGMPVDLLRIPGVLNQQDTKNLFGYDSVKLAPEDRILLRDPRVDRLTKTDLSKVTFLRRTEYVSAATTAKSERKRPLDATAEVNEVLTPSRIVGKVESTFDNVVTDLSKIKHPIKKNVHAVKTWSLLPDTASMDQAFFAVKMIGSAALDNKEKASLDMSTALFRPVELEEDEWVSLYTTEPSSSKLLHEELEQQIDELSENSNVYKFRRFKDYDMKQISSPANSKFLSELALRFNDKKGVVYYKPLRSRLELRRRRINDVIKPLVRENNWDQINLTLRKPTTQETKFRDKVRMRFDPIDFPNVDDDEDDEMDDASAHHVAADSGAPVEEERQEASDDSLKATEDEDIPM